jgi:subtilisin-like proprotein convertase family protein
MAKIRAGCTPFSGRLLTGTQADGYRRGLELTMSGDFPVLLESARYALPASGDPVTATVFAGQNITSALDVNLTQPGSRFRLDSPVLVAAGRSGISVRASSVEFNAPASTAADLTVGPAQVDPAQALEVASAVAQIVDGKVAKIILPSGGWGAGYDADNPPTVRIDDPTSEPAFATVTGLANGRVVSIDITAPGSKYTAAPSVTISAPTGGGRTAQATADISLAGGTVTGINVTDVGSGYNRPPVVTIRGTGSNAAAVANIEGSLATGVVKITNSGSGYAPASSLPLTITGDGSGAVGIAKVDASGKVTSVEITSGGDGYRLGSTRISIPAPSANPSPQVAKATAIVDPATTRIVGFTITDPGSLYGRVPNVTISPPLTVSNAIRPLTTIDAGGRVTGVTFGFGSGLKLLVTGVTRTTGAVANVTVQGGGGGSGYAVGDLASIDSSGKDKGQAAQFRILEVDQSGRVLRVEIVNAGVGYQQAELLAHAGSANRGYGYTSPPRVYFSRPDLADGTQAEAEAAIDLAGRITAITITKPGSGYTKAPQVTVAAVSPVAQAETLRFNTSVAASNYRIELADDPSTSSVVRTTLFVANSGSLTGNLAGTASANTIFVQSRQGDVLLEGTVQAATQSYVLQSGPEDQTLMPFRFTTMTAGSSTPSGWIRGGTVAVTLANDLDTPEKGAVAFNTVSVRTQVDSIRIRAAKRSGAAITEPFPYQLSLSEHPNSAGGDPLGSIAIDAVAASSFPILLAATGNIDFNAALATAGGLTVVGVNTFTVTAPVSTTKGQIKIDAAAITVKNSLQVTDAADDKAQQDIVLDARNGDVILDGGYVSAKNRVVINQKRRVPLNRTFASSSGQQTIADRSTASMSVAVPAGLSIDDLNVALDVTHPDLGDLSATLIAPDGRQIQLFATNRLSGADLNGTVFDSEAEADFPSGKAPYTGSFRPAQSLSSLYSTSPTGIWTVRVTDSFSGDTGTLNGFRVTLRDVLGTTGGQVAGTSRLKADTLVIDAEGSVGRSGLLPRDSGAYLLTDVDTVIAYAGGSFAVSDVSDLNVDTLVARGMVSLRAEGVDPVVDKTTGKATKAALRGTLTDVQSLDLSAPSGSIDVKINTASTTVLGNAAGLSLAEDVRRDRLPSMVAAGSVSVRSVGGSTGGDFVVMDAPLAGSSAKPVRFVTAVKAADINYFAGTPGIYASSITAKANGAITTSLFASLFGGASTAPSPLKVGDRILVANDITGGDRVNGVYAVSRLGGDSTTWQLTRVADGDTAAELPPNSIVRVQEGQDRAAFYRLAYANGGELPFGSAQIAAVPITVTTNISSNDPNDSVRFVVSTADGTNMSPGSLGKMIDLRQANDPSPSESQAMEFSFSPSVGDTIKLRQELPQIVKPFTIDGRSRYPASAASGEAIAIDGSRIDTTRDGIAVGLGTTVDGIVFAATSGGSTTEEAGGLRNIVLGGFAQGSAVIVDGPNVQVDNVVIGENIDGGRLGVRNGIVVNANGVTISGNSISSVGGVALEIKGKASDSKIYGNTIGKNGRDNANGIEVTATGRNVIGDKNQAPNVVSYNGTGIRLASSGGTEVINSVVTLNNGDGIVITAGSNVLGTAAVLDSLKPLAVGANQIAMNKGWGVRIKAATLDAAKSLAKNQKIFGNYFVVPEAGRSDLKNPILGQNQANITKAAVLGTDTAVAVSTLAPNDAGILYQGDAVTEPGNKILQPYPADNLDRTKAGLDPSGNQHFGVGDNVGPSLAMQSPVDAQGAALGPRIQTTDADVKLMGVDASKVKAFVLNLQDAGGLLSTTIVKDAFTLNYGSTPLTEGRDYKFVVSGTNPAILRFETIGVVSFPLGVYRINANSSPGRNASSGTFTGGRLTDRANNVLQGSTGFTISLTGADAPTNVVANAGDGAANVTWVQPGDDGGADITGYVIQASTDAGRTWRNVVNDTKSSITSTTLPGLTNGLTYVFRVAAITEAGQGVVSSPSNAMSPGLPAASKPIATVSAGNVMLAWTAPIGASMIQSYVVQQSVDDGKTWTSSTFTQPTNPGATNLATTVTGLASGSKYLFRVAAVSSVGQGNWSPVSDSVLLLAAPIILNADGGDSSAVLVWMAPVVTGTLTIDDYIIQRSTDGGTTWVGVTDQVSTATVATVSVSNGTAYVFRVAAKAAGVQGEWSAQSDTVTPLGPASAPLSVRGTPGDAKVDLTWTVPVSTGGAAITDYTIESSSNSGGTWSTVAEGVSTVPAATVTGLTNGVSYVFRVTAMTSFGMGGQSLASSPVMPIRTASVPLALRTTVGDGQVVLNWTAPASNGGATITDYAVQRSTDGGRTWIDFVDGVSTATTAPVTGLTNGTSYVFRVAARTIAGLSAWTAASAAVVPLGRASAPRSLQAVAGDGRAVLTWVAPASTSGVPITDYLVQRSTNSGTTWTDVADGVSAVTAATVNGLVNGTAYVFRVAAVTAAGTGVWTSATAGVVPRGPASTPLNVQAIGGNGQVALTWSAPSSNGGSTLRDYLVQSSTDGGRSWSTVADGVSTNTAATVTGLINGISYTYRVAAKTDFATGAYSPATAAIVPLAVPGQITGLQAQAGAGMVNLNWRAPASTGGRPVSDYTIEYSVAGTATWVPWAHAASTATSATITGLAADAGYLFRVRPVTSFASGQPVATTEAVVPSQPPTRVTGRAGNGSVALMWVPPRTTGPARITDYRVQYSVDGVNWTTAVDGVSAASRVTVRGLANGTSYVFRVAAITAKGVGTYSAISARLTPRAR